MKRSGVILGLFVALLAGILLSTNLRVSETKLTERPTENGISAGASQVDLSSGAALEIGGDSRPDRNLDQELSDVTDEEDDVLAEHFYFESQAIKYDSLDTDFVLSDDHVEDYFSRLAEEFRTAADLKGSEKREQFQQFFYAQKQLLSGEVSLDVLECGRQLCVAELRGVDASALRSFMDSQMEWQGFDSKAVIETPTQQANIGRLVFSHDSKIIGVTIPTFGG